MQPLQKTLPPKPEHVVALLAGAPVSSMLMKGLQFQQLKQYTTVKEVALLLDTTPAKVRRIGEAYRHGGIEAAKSLKWGAGRPLK